eukprot:UN22865
MGGCHSGGKIQAGVEEIFYDPFDYSQSEQIVSCGNDNNAHIYDPNITVKIECINKDDVYIVEGACEYKTYIEEPDRNCYLDEWKGMYYKSECRGDSTEFEITYYSDNNCEHETGKKKYNYDGSICEGEEDHGTGTVTDTISTSTFVNIGIVDTQFNTVAGNGEAEDGSLSINTKGRRLLGSEGHASDTKGRRLLGSEGYASKSGNHDHGAVESNDSNNNNDSINDSGQHNDDNNNETIHNQYEEERPPGYTYQCVDGQVKKTYCPVADCIGRDCLEAAFEKI